MEQNQIILLKSTDNSCLVKSSLNIYQQNMSEDILFLAYKESSFLKESFETLKDDMKDFELIYPHVRTMFLRQSWSVLDEMYGKSFFINEMQRMMNDEKISTLCMYRIDTMLDSISSRDCERLISDIVESARYYHKKILFTLNNKTRLGKIIESILGDIVDFEYDIEKTASGICKNSIQKAKNETVNVFVLSNSDELVKFHQYIFKNDQYIKFESAQGLNEKNQNFFANSDVIIYNLEDEKLKNNLLNFIDKQNLKTKLIVLSDRENIRKRDLVKQVTNGVYQVFENNFDLTDYIHTLEKIFRRKFYSNLQDKVELIAENRYFTNSDDFKNIISNIAKYRIYYTAVIVEYENNIELKQDVVENYIRDEDIVYHDRLGKRLVFILIDMLPSNSLSLIERRLRKSDLYIKSSSSLTLDRFVYHIGVDKKVLSVEVL